MGLIGVLVSGEGTNLQALLDDGLPVAAVASNRADARALHRARRAGAATAVFRVAAFGSRAARDRALAEWLESRGVTLVVLAGFMELLTAGFLRRFSAGVVNVHPSLLPAYPGLRAVERALADGVRWTGATVHLVDEGIDTGPPLLRERVPVLPEDTAASLHERIKVAEHRLLPRAVRSLLAERRAA